MTWRVPWAITWLVSWVGPYTSLPSLLPSDVQDALVLNDIPLDVLIPGDPQSEIIRNFNLTVLNRCVDPDGITRCATLVAEYGSKPTLPGPLIWGNKTDRFRINVTNELTDDTMLLGTTIHWHGIFQNHTSQMDGTDGTTQCLIGPGDSFLYDFTARDQVGTFWYHSHYAVQYCDGLRGPFIIYDDKADKAKYGYHVDDNSTIITLMDWYHYPSVVTPRQIWPDSVLINGTGCYHPGMGCDPPATYNVSSKNIYRFRLLNMACKTYYNFSIDGHDLEVIEVEGTYVEPYNVSSISIYAAQRYSFILRPRPGVDQSCNYRIHAVPDPSLGNNSSDIGILRYSESDDFCPDPPAPASDVRTLYEECLRTQGHFDSRLLRTPDVSLFLNISKDMNGTFNFLVNGTQFIPPSVPVLLQIMNGWGLTELEPWKSIVPLEMNQVVELIFFVPDAPGHPHPFHLHGHNFAVINSSVNAHCPDGISGTNPVMRDTVSTGFFSDTNNVTIRFFTDNPGPWFLHCHNEWHLWTGMALIFVEGYDEIKTQPYSTATQEALCTYVPSYHPLPPMKTVVGPYFPPPTPTCTVGASCLGHTEL